MKSEQIVSIYQKSIDLQFTSEIINQEGTFLINSKDHYMSFFLAQYLAKAILCDKNCLNLKKTCQSCQFFDKNQHPDYYYIDFMTKNEDSFYFNEYTDDDVSIVQIRKTIEKIQLSKSISKYSVILINNLGHSSIENLNLLLKTLEEPPEKTIFYLISNYKIENLATISSRCKVIYSDRYFKQDNLAENIEYIINEKLNKYQTINYLSYANTNNYERFKNSDLINIKSGFFDNLELLKDKSFFSNNRDLFYLLIHFLNTVVHDLFMICNNHKDIYNFSYLKTLTKWSKNLNLRNLVDFQNSLLEIQRNNQHLQTNLHTQLYSILTSFRYCFSKDIHSKRFYYEIS